MAQATPSPTVPGAPTSVSATPGETSATVTWTAPASDGGSPILQYEVRIEPHTRVLTTKGAETGLVFDSVRNGSPHTFTVVAVNSVGAGAPSAPSNRVRPGEEMPWWLPYVELGYILVLIAAAWVYAGVVPGWNVRTHIPATVASVPISIPWFGALGAVTIGLYGIFWHNRNDWQGRYNIWHISRPITGSILGLIGYLIYVAVIKSS